MKKQIALYALVAAALLAAPASIQAEAQPAKPAESAEAATPGKKHEGLPFRGKVSSVDVTAKTVTLGKRTFNVTAETKIMKEAQPATLADMVVGEKITGQYKKADADQLNALVIYIGGKDGKGEAKQKAEKAEKE